MNRLKYFRLEEFSSPDSEGSGDMMETDFLEMLDIARAIAHNQKIGGERNSSHLMGWAADLHCGTGKRRFLMIEALLDAGFTRLGIGENFIHADCDPNKPQMTIWTY